MEGRIYNFDSPEIQYLRKTNNNLCKLIDYIGECRITLEKNGFMCLVKYIIGQQISDKARETIWIRLCNMCGHISPEIIYDLDNSKLKEIGLSSRKVEYIKNLANAVIRGNVNFESFNTIDNESVIKILTNVKGIGRWTAEMYLIFSLGRIDVLSRGDGTIKRGIKWMYNLKDIPNEEEIENYFYEWKDYATVVSLYFWKAVELGIMSEDFNKL